MDAASTPGPVAAFLDRGFRPFFLLAAVFGALAVPAWLWALARGAGGRPVDLAWHSHEMIFGYLGAVVAGFLLTAVPSWTGRPPVRGALLAALAGLWLASRAGSLAPGAGTALASAAGCAFTVALAGVAWHEVARGGNLRNVPVCLLVTGFALADLASTPAAAAAGMLEPATAQRLALGCLAVLLMLIGGRITPAFTRNWMQGRGLGPLPASFSRVDAAALACGVAAVAAWVAAPRETVTGALLAAAGLAHLVRLVRWRGAATLGEPLVTVLHAAYAWIPAWLLLGAVAVLDPVSLSPSAALHALTAGALTAMPMAVMTRATLGHTGRPLTADTLTRLLFVLVFAAGALRVAAAGLPLPYVTALAVSGLLWAAAQVLFLVRYGPMLLRAAPAP